jgi:threonine synthase
LKVTINPNEVIDRVPIIRCVQCHHPYPKSGIPYRCPDCGGIFDFDGPPDFNESMVDKSQPGYWRYHQSFSLFDKAPFVTLGEGGTPLVWDKIDGREVGFKLEYLNPTGSYKDRGSAVLVSQLLARGVQQAVEDSSGNAGASFAAYAARAGLRAKVFIPDYASGPKRKQIEMGGAEVVPVPGPRSAASKAVLQEADRGIVYASHAYLPFGLPGIATIAYELWEEIGRVPGTVIAPVGHGGLLLGIVRGFAALKNGGITDSVPYYIGVQASSCAPVVSGFLSGEKKAAVVDEGATLAEGVRVSKPARASALLNEINSENGEFLAIEEEEILPAYKQLAAKGFFVEPTSGLAWSAYNKLSGKIPEPVILILTGSGLKYQP